MAYGDYLIPATVANKAALVNYINSNLVDAGGTNFRDSLTKAFDILKASLGAGSSSMCMRAVMFLTDGVAEFNNNDYAQAKSRVDELSVAMFTYALGWGNDRHPDSSVPEPRYLLQSLRRRRPEDDHELLLPVLRLRDTDLQRSVDRVPGYDHKSDSTRGVPSLLREDDHPE